MEEYEYELTTIKTVTTKIAIGSVLMLTFTMTSMIIMTIMIMMLTMQ